MPPVSASWSQEARPNYEGSTRQFAYVPNARPVVQGTVGALVLLSLSFVWVWWSGRMAHVDATFVGVMVASVVVGIGVRTTLVWRRVRRAASAVGQVEVNAEGVTWTRQDASIGFTETWTDIERATVDARNSMVILFRPDNGPLLIGVLSEHGVPSGFVVLERFGEFVEFVSARVPLEAHAGSKDEAAGRRTLLLGLVTSAVAAVLYGANLLVAHCFDWTRLLVHMPVVVGAVGLLTLVAGARVRAGKGPLVSPIYAGSHQAGIIRFLVVASVSNFVLLVVVNAFAM